MKSVDFRLFHVSKQLKVCKSCCFFCFSLCLLVFVFVGSHQKPGAFDVSRVCGSTGGSYLISIKKLSGRGERFLISMHKTSEQRVKQQGQQGITLRAYFSPKVSFFFQCWRIYLEFFKPLLNVLLPHRDDHHFLVKEDRPNYMFNR
ncbi:unnamed protein product [Amoebophrya sp. A25]|nr:unnamed protein product [Amoebophrya sp. A25]|eukprot:GSA25T00000444001.1